MHLREGVVASLAAWAAVALCTAGAALGQGPAFLVKDIHNVSDSLAPYYDQVSSNPRHFAVLDGVAYFAAGDSGDDYYQGSNGAELWRSDGTPAGTYLVKDIHPGRPSASPNSLQVHDGALYFLADDGQHGPGLWRSDGTAVGTERVATIGAPGQADGLTRLGSMWLFLAASARGIELWRVDPDGGRSLALLDAQSSALYPHETQFVAGERLAYFVTRHPEYGVELWRTDGTGSGTAVIDINPGPSPSHPRQLVAIGDAAYFINSVGEDVALWRADAQGAEALVPWHGGVVPMNFTAANGAWLLTAAASDGGGWHLWRSDGSATGTQPIAQLAATLWVLQPFIAHGGHFFFAAGHQLWRTDATAAGTAVIYEDEGDPDAHQVLALASAGDKMLFIVGDGSAGHTHALWRTDGTAGGTAFVRDFHPVTEWNWAALRGAVIGDGRFVFAADGGNGVEPWVTDGTAARTAQLAEIGSAGGDSLSEDMNALFADLNGKLLFLAYDRMVSGLWTSDATEAGTVPVPSVHHLQNPPSLWPVGDRVYFPFGDVAGHELWELASLDRPPRFLTDIFPGSDSSFPSLLANLDGELIISANDGIHGREPWAPYDQGLIADIQPGPQGSDPREPVILNGALYFLAEFGLWRTDGTPLGTLQVADVEAGQNARLVGGGDRLALLTGADDGTGFPWLWMSDGTPDGTVAIREFLPISDADLAYQAWPQPLGFAGRTFLFAVGDDAHGVEIWRSDGTAAGTGLLADIHPGPGGSFPTAPVSRGDALLFFADDGTHGREPWISDGTAAGTRMLADIQPGPLASRGRFDEARIAVGNAFVFAASDGVNGLELWQSDGSTAGTMMMQDIAPAAHSSSPEHFTVSGDHLYFIADDNRHGRELWAMALRDVACSHDCPDPHIPTPTPQHTPRPVWTPGEPLPAYTPTVTPTRSVTPHCHRPGDGEDCVFLTVGSASGAPGERVEIEVSLRTGGLDVAGVQLDLHPADALRPAYGSGGPSCRVNPGIDKNGTAFGHLGGSGVRAIVIAFDNVDPIPDGALLFTCAFDIAADAVPGTVPIACSNHGASTPDGTAIPRPDEWPDFGDVGELLCFAGAVTIEGAGRSPTPTGTPLAAGQSDRALSAASSGSGCHIDGDETSAHALLLFLPIAVILSMARAARRTPVAPDSVPGGGAERRRRAKRAG